MTGTRFYIIIIHISKKYNNKNKKVNPCGNFSDTFQITDQSRLSMKGAIGHDVSICIRTENQN